MPLSSLVDPADIALAQAALAAAWETIITSGEPLLGTEPEERHRLAVIVAGLVGRCGNQQELADQAVQRFRR